MRKHINTVKAQPESPKNALEPSVNLHCHPPLVCRPLFSRLEFGITAVAILFF